MNINSDINVLGSLGDYRLINHYFGIRRGHRTCNSTIESNFTIKTTESIKRYEHAIMRTVLTFKNPKVETLTSKLLTNEGISSDSLLMLFWNASVNNELLNYLNCRVYFPALYSGRFTIKKEEVIACLEELRLTEMDLKKWSRSTMDVTARKYIYFLSKFNLLEGGKCKEIIHRYLSDKTLILFVYWLLAVETKSNILESQWLPYCFSERHVFIQQILQKKFIRFITLLYTGDNLKIETSRSYEEIYDELK